jgi:hypothetical protein
MAAALDCTIFLTVAGLAVGLFCKYSAAIPATNGAETEVPVNTHSAVVEVGKVSQPDDGGKYELPLSAAQFKYPGAKISTQGP